MVLPSAVKTGSVSIEPDWAMRRGSEPTTDKSSRLSWDPPSRLRVSARVLPSGDQAGALLEPLKLATRRRLPDATSWT